MTDQEPTGDAAKAPSIIVVEDEAIIALDLNMMLTRLGYEVLGTAASGADCLRLIEERLPDLVLMDIAIKGDRDGVDVSGEVSERFGIPVVFVTANADRVTVERAGRSEPYGFVTKPVKVEHLHAAIEVALNRHRADQRVQAVMNSKMDFLSMIAHEFNSPMSAILGFAEMLSEEEDAPESTQMIANAIERASRSFSTLVNDLLDLARIDAGFFDLHESEFDVGEVVQDVVDAMQVIAEEKGVRLVTRGLPDPGSSWLGDSTRVRQVLQNIVSNAVKFTPEGEVSVAVNLERGVVLAVTDTGPGIAAEDLDRIFEPFHRGSSAREKGTGLGLSISSRLAEAMGGSIKVESTVGRGTTFTVALPLRRA